MALKSVESQNMEFKSNWRDEYLKVICAFANADGGRLVIGIDDKGKSIGVENAKKLLEDVPNKIKDILGIIPKVITEGKKGKDTLIIEVKPSYAPISYHGRYFVRSGSTIQELKGKELTKFLISKSDRDWDEYAEEKSSMADIDVETVERFKEIAIKRLPFVKEEKDNLKLLQKLNLVENGKLKRAAISDLKTIFTDIIDKTLYRDLQLLVRKNILEQSGEKKGRKYKLR